MKKYAIVALLFLSTLLSGCTGIPEGIEPVKGFELKRYLGKWYEIARLDHSFERGLNNITAEYQLKQDGDVRVLNRGYNIAKKRWQEAEGTAKFVDSPDIGRLKVSFFGPFYGGYNIINLDKKNYQYVMIVGNNRKYLWILSRTPQLDPDIKSQLLEQAKNLSFPVDDLIYVEHDTP